MPPLRRTQTSVAWDPMCGIVGIVSRPPTLPVPTADEIVAGLDAALAARPDVAAVAAAVDAIDARLRGLPGLLALADHHELVSRVESRLDELEAFADEVDDEIEAGVVGVDEIEAASARLVALRDATWAIRHDRLRTAREVSLLAGRDASVGAMAGYLAVQRALSAIDRLEVRGRDSAGLHLFVWNHGLDESDPSVGGLVAGRDTDPLYQSESVRWIDGCLSFVYKAAAEIGELGDNTRVLRAAVANDAVLRRALAGPDVQVAVLGHTRWASVGIISEPNTHPLNSEELERRGGEDPGPYVVAALNGDVDNHADLRVEHGLRIHGQITTDAKVIPALVARHALAGNSLVESFRRTVAAFDGSVAIGAASATAPNTLLLALRGSGQGLFVGFADDCYIVASEPYGLVEETSRYLRLDGEHGGEIVVLDGADGGDLSAVRRLGYDGAEMPIRPDEIITAEVTTRDIDRGDSPHYLWKEIGEAPESFRKTLRGKIVERDGVLHADVGARAFPDSVAARLAAGTITRIRVIGQGTAAVAGQSTAAILDELCDGSLDIDADHGDRAVGVQHAARHERHARDRRQPERHHHRHEPHGRPAAWPRRRRARHRQPPRAASSSTRPTASCTRRTVAMSR